MTGMRSLFVLAMLGAHGAAAADNEVPQVTPALRQRAEDLAGAASQRFTDILDGGKRQELAQSGAPLEATDKPAAAGTFAPVWNWLARSSEAYDDVVIAQLKNPDGWTVIVQRSGDAEPVPAPSAPTAQEEPPRELRGWSGLVEMMRDWLARANRSYRNEIVKPLLEPVQPAPPSEFVEQPPSGASPSPMAPQTEEQIKRDAEAADAKRVAEEAEAQRRSLQAKRTAEEDEAKRKAEAAAQAKGDSGASKSKRAADAEAKRTADEAESKRRMEAQAADAERRADEEKRRAEAAEAKRKAQAEARAKLVEEAAEARRKADAEAKRVADEAEAKRKVDEAKRIADEAEAKRKADEAKRLAEEADAERKAVAEAEAETKRKAEIEAEATRRSQAAARAKEAARAEVASPAPVTPQSPTPAKEPPAVTPTPPAAKTRSAGGTSPAPALRGKLRRGRYPVNARAEAGCQRRGTQGARRDCRDRTGATCCHQEKGGQAHRLQIARRQEGGERLPS